MTFAASLLVLAIVGQIFLTLAVYLLMGRRRFAAARAGKVEARTYVLVVNEPPELARITRNLANQFELPVIFYVVALMLLSIEAVTLFDAAVAWLFVVARVVHASIHIRTEEVLLRSRVFFASFGCVALLALHLAYVAVVDLL